MSVQRADARFILPHPVKSVAILGPSEEWERALTTAGVTVTGLDDEPDLVVAPPSRADEALAAGSPGVLVEGRLRHKTGPAGAPLQRVLALPEVDQTRLMVPLDQRAPLRYTLRTLAPPRTAWKRYRNLVLRGVVARGFVPPRLPTVSVASEPPGPPYFVGAARDLGVPSDARWMLTLGANPGSRSAFQLFRPGDSVPRWALKFSRVPGQERSFDNDERGLTAARASGGRVAAAAPLLLGRFVVGGLEASLETAAVGRPLFDQLSTDRSRARQIAAIEAIAEWVVEVGVETKSEPAALEAEREWLAAEIVPRWASHGVRHDLLDQVLDVPAVFVHGDLGPLNVIASRDGFCLVDWENSRTHGFPLWDLCFFLNDAASVVERVPTAARDDYVVRLWRGEEELSDLLFRWVRRAVVAIGVPDAAVGPVITLMWLGHGVSAMDRREALRRLAGTDRSRHAPAERLARRWLAEPGLGASWDRWRQ